jgi:hypothetical protein
VGEEKTLRRQRPTRKAYLYAHEVKVAAVCKMAKTIREVRMSVHLRNLSTNVAPINVKKPIDESKSKIPP